MKKVISIILFAVLAIMFSATAFADGTDIIASGYCGAEGNKRNLTWTLTEGGTLTISGEGKMADYNSSSTYGTIAPWREYGSSLKTLILKEGITTIGECAFYNCGNFSGNLIVPESVIAIGYSAFENCYGFFGDLIIPEGVITIGDYAFSDCWNFSGNLVIPNSVTTIGDSAFWNCSRFSGQLVIPDSVTYIGSCAFYGCSGFYGNLVIPDSVKTIERSAFENCSGFTGDLIIPNSITTISDSTFAYCEGLNGNLIIPDSVTTIGEEAFNGCNGFNGSLAIPDSITTIGAKAFYYCGFYDYLFYGDAPVAYANTFNKYYDTIYYPSGNSSWNPYWKEYTTIAWNPDAIESGYCGGEGDGTNLTWIIDENGTLTILGTGKMADYIHKYTNNREITTAPWGKYRYKLKSLIIGEGVTSIGKYSFYNCDGIKGNVVIPDRIEIIGIGAFYGCSGFKGNLVIGSGVIDIGDSAFYGCGGFTGNLIIPDTVTNIGDSAFYGCTGFNGNLIIGNGVQYIGANAFRDCSGFRGTLTLGCNLKRINNNAFYGCSGFIGDLIIPDSVTNIEKEAFYYCTGFNGNLKIGNNVKSIGDSAFYYCSGFKGDLAIPDSVTCIGSSAFYGCSGFDENLKFGKNVICIHDNVFCLCSGFVGNVIFSEYVSQIGKNAFYRCSIEKYYFKGDAPSVFDGNSSDCSFDFYDDTIYYPAENNTWETINGRWKGYVATEWNNNAEICEHSFCEWIVATAPTCTEKGEERRDCVNCEYYETREIAASGHIDCDAIKEDEVAATCNKDGRYYSVVYCAVCNEELDREFVVVPATGKHVYATEKERKEPTCTEDGYVIMVCGCGATEKTVLPATGHDYKSVVTEPTCTEQGYITHTCKVCSDSYVDSYVDATGHSFGEWYETKAPTEIEKGEERRDCENCDYYETREVEALGEFGVLYGDVNGDGRVNIADANLVRRYAAKLLVLENNQIKAADVNGDGKVNIADANLIRRFAAKLIDKFPVEE